MLEITIMLVRSENMACLIKFGIIFSTLVIWLYFSKSSLSFKISTFDKVIEKYLVEAVHESVIIASNLIDQSWSGEISARLSKLGHFFQGENSHRANVVPF